MPMPPSREQAALQRWDVVWRVSPFICAEGKPDPWTHVVIPKKFKDRFTGKTFAKDLSQFDAETIYQYWLSDKCHDRFEFKMQPTQKDQHANNPIINP